MKTKTVKVNHSVIADMETKSVKKEVMAILRMNDFEYYNTLFETGLKWLEKNYNSIPCLYETYKQSRIFWKWYSNQYHLMNCKFIEKVKTLSLFQDNVNTLSKLYFKTQIEMPFSLDKTAQKMIYAETIQSNPKNSAISL